MTGPETRRKKVTVQTLQQKKQDGEQITMLTAYDYPTAMAVDRAGIDAILVGDSLGMVVLGYESTLPVTMEEMLHHCKAVRRGVEASLLIGDMPFMSYQVSPEKALENAGRLIQEAGMDVVKLEGGRERLDAVKKIVEAGIPVMGHLGLTPQRVNQFGGFKAQGKTAFTAKMIYEDSLLLQDAGCTSVVLEVIPTQLANFITRKLDIPTIGIGAGGCCDGQVLVTHDLIGLFDRFTPKFVKQYVQIHQEITTAFNHFREDVLERRFPQKEHEISMSEDNWNQFLKDIGDELS